MLTRAVVHLAGEMQPRARHFATRPMNTPMQDQSPEPFAVETVLRVRYAETDAMGVVYHANYLVWFEVGRGEYFRAIGQDYEQWERDGYLLPVSEAYARYHGSARYGDLITVRTSLQEIRSRSLTLVYEVRLANGGTVLATGWTKHLCVDGEGNVCRLPRARFHALEAT